MYSDPKRVRNNRLTIRLDDYEHELIQALANYTGEQPSTLLRQMALMQAEETLCLSHPSSLSTKAA